MSRKRGQLFVGFIDFKTVFDLINRNKLWQVLNDIKAKVICIIYLCQCIYKRVTACVRCNNGSTDYLDCKIGLNQGCLISPQLLSFFVNELVKELKRSGIKGIQRH